jgi:uncharacterized protein (DUF302 family)
MLANICVESHLREFLEQGFEVAIVRDATAGPRHPVWGDGYKAAMINYHLSHTLCYRPMKLLIAYVDRHDGVFGMTADGLIACVSKFCPRETARRAVAVKSRGISITAHIDHAAAVGMELRPTEVLIFGNPRAGTPLMQAVQTVGIDLPLKVLVWQDEDGMTWLAYNDPQWLAHRHGAAAGLDRNLHAMADALAAVAREETRHPHRNGSAKVRLYPTYQHERKCPTEGNRGGTMSDVRKTRQVRLARRQATGASRLISRH